MQITAPLPRDRIEQSPTFAVTGLDFAGPIFVKTQRKSLLAVKLSTLDCVVDKRVLIKRFNYRERLLNNFWRQWRKDYLLNLKSVHFVNPTKETEFKINDIVLIHDDRLPRSLWKLGKVVEISLYRS
ncbi:integrase catalytic domain-containing protein [Trichonephila clavata]|uniref:Integrase catalytic domain-containing protein n=1 Tax=Trichonephila clavata TaxID=2740835 RepID=A0A8X6G0H3_TRICU|nr:integrase catalytic domain-containing protein [Trichonephila clavata]